MPGWQTLLLNLNLRFNFRRKQRIFNELTPEAIAGYRLMFNEYCENLPQPPAHITIEKTQLAQFHGEKLSSPDADNQKAILFFHGCGYFMGSAKTHRTITWRLVEHCKSPVFAINYPLAPEQPFPQGFNAAKACYQALLDQGYRAENIVLVGASSGGGLALSLLNHLNKSQLHMAKAAILISPWTDLTCSGKSFETNQAKDVMFEKNFIEREAYLYGQSYPLDYPDISPLYADLKNLPPLLFIASESEVLRDDSVRYVHKALDAGVEAEIELWHGVPHSFLLFADIIPEGQQAFERIAQFYSQLFA